VNNLFQGFLFLFFFPYFSLRILAGYYAVWGSGQVILFHVARCCYSFQSLCYLVSNDYVTNGCLQACPGQNENLSLTLMVLWLGNT